MAIEYYCPYCKATTYSNNSRQYRNTPFPNWKAVRMHTRSCNLNKKTFVICDHYGPISLDKINSYISIQAFKKDFPKFSFNSHYFCSLRSKGLSTVSGTPWNKENIIKAIQKFVTSYNYIPTASDFDLLSIKDYPSRGTVLNYFSSWDDAIILAGFTPVRKYSKSFGTPTVAKDNILYRSKAEAYFVDNYLYNKYKYEYEKPYGNGWYFDFYLPEQNLYIEIDGGLRPERIKEKIDFCYKKNLKLIVIPIDDLEGNSFKLP